MKKYIRITIWVILTIGLIVGLIFAGIFHQNRICKSLKLKIEYNNAEPFFTEDEIIKYLINKNDSIIGKKISEINENLIENILKENPYIYNAEVFVNMDGDIKIDITQRKPLVRIVNKQNQHFYLDDKGVKIPVKIGFPANVVIANGNISAVYVPFRRENEGQKNDTLNLQKDTVLYSVFKIAEYLNRNDFFKAQIEEIFVNESKEIELFPKLGDQIIIFGSIENLEDKFNKLMILYKDGFNKVGWEKYSIINLKYKDQIVCTKRNLDKSISNESN
jgi:cell division protein FtsQ